jgi:hypothetical protein
MSTHSYAYLIFDKDDRNIQWRKDRLFNKCCWEKWLSACKNLKPGPCLSPCTSINSKWIDDLNIRPKTLKLLQERAGNTLKAIGIGKDFLNTTPAVQQLRERMDKWDFIKFKSFCTTKKKMVSKLKRPPTEWEKTFVNYTSDKGLITRIYRELKKQNSLKNNEPIKKWAAELNRTFSKEKILQMCTISSHKGSTNQKILPHTCSNSYHQKTPLTTGVGEDVGKKEP